MLLVIRQTQVEANMSICLIFILFVFIDAVHCQCDGNHVNLPAAADGIFRRLQSPNYGDEHGRRTNNCAWTINLPSPKQYVIVFVEDLRLHYLDKQNNIHCMPSYDFRINGEKFGCEPGQFVSTEKNEFCIQFRTPTCARLNACSEIRQTLDKVQITFDSDGQRVEQGQTPIMNGFRIRYGIFYCPGFGTSITNARTTVTRTSLAVSTQRPFNTFPGNRNSVGRPHATESTPLSTIISTVRTTTTTNAETNKAIPTSSKSIRISSDKTDSSNEIPIWVSDASNATRGLQLTSTISPTANRSRVEDDFNTNLPSTIDTHWIILPSAVAGGLLIILLVVIVLMMQRFATLRKLRESRHREPSNLNAAEYDNVAPSPIPKISGPEESHQYAMIKEGYDNLQLVETPGYQTARREGSYIEVNPIGVVVDDTKDSFGYEKVDKDGTKDISGYEKIELRNTQSIKAAPTDVKVSSDSEIATGGPIQKHLYDPVG